MIISALLVVLALYCVPTFYKIVKAMRHTAPGSFYFLRPMTALSESLPSLRWVVLNISEVWNSHFDLFVHFDSSVVTYRSSTSPQVLIADAAATRHVYSNPKTFIKPVQDYAVLGFFGPNVVTTEGTEWRRHRKLTAPSFSERNNEYVWTESRRIVHEWFEMLSETGGDAVEVETVDTTLRMTLMIISAAAFGEKSVWPSNTSKDEPLPGRQLGFITALKGCLDGTITKLILPNWVYKLPLKYPRYVALCFSELDANLRDMVERRRLEKSSGAQHNDLFNALLDGVEDDEKDAVLTTAELVGNIYIFLLAGHETTAHTLAFLFTLLALYPEQQEILHNEAEAAFGGRESVYDDYSKLPYALATLHETLRLFPPVVLIPKIATEDAILPAHTTGPDPQPTTIHVPSGSRVALLASSLHLNPMYWDEPYDFNPSRFIDTEEHKWNRDAFTPFSGGTRGCLGQKFAQVESVVIISHICQAYTIEITPECKEKYATREGESQRDRRERIFAPYNRITLTPSHKLPLVFKRRQTKV